MSRLGTLDTIFLAHDYICPWSYVGWHHARRLRDEFGVDFDWHGFELIPPDMEFNPSPPPAAPVDPNEPPPRPTGRFGRYVEGEGIAMRFPLPPFTRSHCALLGAEFARAADRFDAYNDAVYRAYWDEHQDIADLDVLRNLAQNAGLDPGAFAASIESEQYADRIVPFDDPAYAIGIRHIPTFIFGAEEQMAEANYSDLAHATERFLFRLKKRQGK
jgi:predicted DsbA family dithiol-disulfide isomerase